jgi:hypothetical protein
VTGDQRRVGGGRLPRLQHNLQYRA